MRGWELRASIEVLDAEGFGAEEGGAVFFVLGFEFAAVGGADANLDGAWDSLLGPAWAGPLALCARRLAGYRPSVAWPRIAEVDA